MPMNVGSPDHGATSSLVKGKSKSSGAGGGTPGNPQDLVPAPLDISASLNEGPKDFGFLLRGSSPSFIPTPSLANAGLPCFMLTPSMTDGQFGDCDGDDDTISNGKRPRPWKTNMTNAGDSEGAARRSNNPGASGLEKRSSRGNAKGQGKGEVNSFAHQRCFEWSRKAAGCSEPCPNGRAHVCEFCGSPDHRGIMAVCTSPACASSADPLANVASRVPTDAQ